MTTLQLTEAQAKALHRVLAAEVDYYTREPGEEVPKQQLAIEQIIGMLNKELWQ